VRDDEGVEFLHPEPGPDAGRSGEDALDPGAHRPIPRWVIGLTGLGIAVVVVLALTLSSSGAPGAAPSSAVPAPSVTTEMDPVGPTQVVFPPPDRLPVGPGVDGTTTVPYGPIEAAAFDESGRLELLSPEHLTVLDHTGTVVGDYDMPGVGGSPQTVPWHLVPVGERLWAVGGDGTGTQLIELESPPTVSILRRTSLPVPVTDVAGYRGTLYLATGNAVYRVPSGASRPALVPGLSAYSIAADPSRQRLLVLGSTARRASLRAYYPSGGASRPVVNSVPLVKGSLRVSGSTIWLGGFGPYGAVLTRLDPTTLRAIAPSPLSASFGPGALLVGTGGSVLWVRGGGGGDDLWCVAASGTAAQHWSGVSGSVASRPGAAFVAEAGTTVHRLRLTPACRG
jgi:hypothetical protein